ncbi:hypothetical protein M8C21_030596 [Ambrosia artemisiifolia]|uniref:Uncharacterized protein n=1 Tax=Ambrosia artemisiifolia TaxID=4212 RepID=A0AAD5CTN5_AMBAR|nr:hypothetical protein M8C21_030596 [Ambrosia artemisiifolia]
MMLTIETRLQNPVRSSAAALYNSVNPSVPLASSANNGDWQDEVYQQIKAMKDLYDRYLLDSTAHTGNLNGEDVLEEVYQKIKAMKDLYLLDLIDVHQKVASKLKQHHSYPRQLHEKLKLFKEMVERFIQFLQFPKHGKLANYKDKLGTYERQIISVINTTKRKPGSSQQQPQA